MPEGEDPDCTEDARSHAIETADDDSADASPHAVKTVEKTETAERGEIDAKPSKRGKLRSARSRKLPAFFRKVDLFLQERR